ncbi:hypothetical protein M2347_002309 [Chryseobacterium sp. H1D6B]|uniref:hypothetical protein n=1 Tax=Chryseobacterium sp. H1D6B TaxID=2940588 RepID=UPI0015C8EE92|nr:hypothetical protein [Chryseobacterium sp. H1D6B]MDH6252582.1 hypothetical protein [Chryseobacterium sp. H1D6B]
MKRICKSAKIFPISWLSFFDRHVEGDNGLGGNTAYKYQYNSKELQEESGMYNYGWRQYMPELGRWGCHRSSCRKHETIFAV